MDWTIYLYIIIAILLMGHFSIPLLTHVIRPYFFRKQFHAWASQPKIDKPTQLFNALYKNFNAFPTSHISRARFGLSNDISYTYGEVVIPHFVGLLEIVTPNKNDIFYDLGCGSGKSVMATMIFYNIRMSIGIEILPELYSLSCQQLTKYIEMTKDKPSYAKRAEGIAFINNDINQCDISNGTIVFINATTFSDKLWFQIQSKLETLRSGARVIVTTQEIQSPHFTLLFKKPWIMSWGLAITRIYEKQ